jgi:ribosome recycling factor
MVKDIETKAEDKMDNAIDVLKAELSTLRAGRANPKMLDRITVDYYGSPTPIAQMASVSAPEPRMILIQPWDSKAIPLIEKAILASDIGINPGNDGRSIRLVIPQLTEERRKELVKLSKKEGENTKVAIRNIRRTAIEELKAAQKSSKITEDDCKDGENSIQKITDNKIKKIDDIVKVKESEIMEI